jgi:hypothetical protein
MSKLILVADFADGAVPSAVQELIDVGVLSAFVEQPRVEQPRLKQVGSPSKEEVRSAIETLVNKHRLTKAGVAALLGVAWITVYNWSAGNRATSPECWSRIVRLVKRAEKNPDATRSEARGAARAAIARLGDRKSSRRLTSEDSLEIATKREAGDSLRSLAREYGVNATTIRRAVEKVRRLTA